MVEIFKPPAASIKTPCLFLGKFCKHFHNIFSIKYFWTAASKLQKYCSQKTIFLQNLRTFYIKETSNKHLPSINTFIYWIPIKLQLGWKLFSTSKLIKTVTKSKKWLWKLKNRKKRFFKKLWLRPLPKPSLKQSFQYKKSDSHNFKLIWWNLLEISKKHEGQSFLSSLPSPK